MGRSPLIALAVGMLLLPALPGHAQLGSDTVLRELGRQVGEVEAAVRTVEAMREKADADQRVDTLACLDDRLSWLRGLQIAGRAGVDEFAVASAEQDEAGMAAAVAKVGVVVERAPDLLAEAEACELGQTERAERCSPQSTLPGEACTELVVRLRQGYGPTDDDFGAVFAGAFTRPPDASPTR